MRTRRSLAQLLAALLVVPLLALLPAAPAHADAVPPTNYSPVAISDLPLASTVMTDAAGGVTVGCPQGGSTTSFKSFNAAGSLVQNQAVGSNPSGPFCASNGTVGKDGTVYRSVNDSGTDYYVQAWKNNSLVWQYALPCAPYAYPSSMVMGADGNVYMVVEQGSCSSQRLIGLSAAAQPSTNPPAPQVVMDEAISGFVQGNALAVYNDGLVLYKNGSVQYVSYSGTFATPVSPNDMVNTYVGYDWFTATTSGRVFLPIQANWTSSTGCSDQSNAVGSIKAVDPDDIAWTISISSCVYVREIHPTPNNGFLMRFSYAPTTGGDPVEKVAAYDGSGSLLWVKPIQGVDSLGVLAVSADLNGNVVVRRDSAEWHTVNGSSYRFPETDVTLLDGFSGEVLKQFALRGESDTIDGPSYMWGNGGSTSMGKNTFYVTAQECAYLGGCDSSNPTKLYAFSVPGLAMDYPRGAILRHGEPLKTYVAMGDSFGSGQGAPPYEAGTNTAGPPENRCMRSTGAYARLLGEVSGSPLDLAAFVACGGATTSDVENGRFNESPQFAALSVHDPDVVTISIGGNDIGFAQFVTTCLFLDCSDANWNQQYFDNIDDLPSALDGVYDDILYGASNAQVYVLGYPQVIPDPSTCSNPLGSWVAAFNTLVQNAHNQVAGAEAALMAIGHWAGVSDAIINAVISAGQVAFTTGEMTTGRNLTVALDEKIQDTVGAVRPRLRYVDPLASGSPFTGHELCTNNPYFTGLDVANTASSFHPNSLGQNAYRQLLLSAM